MSSAAASACQEVVYPVAIGVGRFLFGGLLRLKPVVSGAQHIPRTGGAVLAVTHFGYMDFALLEWVIWRSTRRRVRFLVTRRAFDKPIVGWLLRSMGHIPVDMKAGRDAYGRAVEALRSGELVGVFPEAGVSASFTVRELKTGAARMAIEADVPLVPVVLWGGQLLKTKNHSTQFREAFRAPILVDVGDAVEVADADDPVATTDALRLRLQQRLDVLQRSFPLPGAGRWWQPAHLGGTAPTPEAAAAADAARQKRREANRGRPA